MLLHTKITFLLFNLPLICSMIKLSTILLCLCLFTNCKTTSKNSKSKPLVSVPADLLGDFKDDYDIRYTINESLWIQHPNIKYHLLKYDTAGQYFIAKNASTNPSEAGLFTRIDVMRFNNMEPWSWGFCLTAYKAKTFEEAIANQSADRNNPKKGCGGYPFSRMKKDSN